MKTYFIQAKEGGPIKIGRSRDPGKRLSDLQTSHASELILLGSIDGDCEKSLHVAFGHYRAKGEWFHLSAEILNFLRARGVEPGPAIPDHIIKHRNMEENHPLKGLFDFCPGDWYDAAEFEQLIGILTAGDECKCEPATDENLEENDDDEESPLQMCSACRFRMSLDVIANIEVQGFVWRESDAMLAVVYPRDAFGRRALEVTETLEDEFAACDEVGVSLVGISHSMTGGFRDEQIFVRAFNIGIEVQNLVAINLGIALRQPRDNSEATMKAAQHLMEQTQTCLGKMIPSLDAGPRS